MKTLKRTPVTDKQINSYSKDDSYFELCKNRTKEHTIVTFCSHHNLIETFDGGKSGSCYTMVFDFNANLVFTTDISWSSNLTIKIAQEFIRNGKISKKKINDLTNEEIESVRQSFIRTKIRVKEISDIMSRNK